MYKLTDDKNVVIREEDGATIPANDQNPDYVKYLEWLEAGGVPTQSAIG